MLHGWGMNQGIWQLQKEALEACSSHTYTTLNLPGYGGNKFSGGNYSIDASAEQLAPLLPDHAILVAWSLSGLVALRLAQIYPQKVAKIIFVASSPFFAKTDNWPGIEANVLDNFMQQLSKYQQKTIDRFLAIQAMGSEHAKKDIKQIKALLSDYPKADDLALSSGLEILKHDDMRAVFVSLSIPISGIFGRLDSLVPAASIKQMGLLREEFRADILPKASHAPFISHPKEFSDLLLSHISR